MEYGNFPGIHLLTYRDAGPVTSETRYILVMIVAGNWTRMDVSSIDPEDIINYGEKLIKSFSKAGVAVEHSRLYDYTGEKP